MPHLKQVPSKWIVPILSFAFIQVLGIRLNRPLVSLRLCCIAAGVGAPAIADLSFGCAVAGLKSKALSLNLNFAFFLDEEVRRTVVGVDLNQPISLVVSIRCKLELVARAVWGC